MQENTCLFFFYIFPKQICRIFKKDTLLYFFFPTESLSKEQYISQRFYTYRIKAQKRKSKFLKNAFLEMGCKGISI